ncbi:unnamed protein product, partial [Rotaria sp. Silwood1]
RLLKPIVIPPSPLTSTIRSKYLQQFHLLVDVTKYGFMNGIQAKNILQQTGLSQMLLHQIGNLADHDKDDRLTPDEFVFAMHYCDIDGYKELQQHRQLLREQEKRVEREREERECKRELELQKQKQKDNQKHKKQMEFERQLKRERQMEQPKEEERRKLFEQRETARKEIEYKSRLEWERQHMQELTTQ